MHDDPRIPVLFAPAAMAGAQDAVLSSLGPPRPRHRIGCACCGGRGPAAEALRRLYLDRARGVGTPFARLIADLPPGEAAELRAALAGDVFAAGRYRIAE